MCHVTRCVRRLARTEVLEADCFRLLVISLAFGLGKVCVGTPEMSDLLCSNGRVLSIKRSFSSFRETSFGRLDISGRSKRGMGSLQACGCLGFQSFDLD